MAASLITMLFVLFIYRLHCILPTDQTRKRRVNVPSLSTCTVAVFLGSGGHTSEALTLVSSLDLRRYNRRIYIVSSGDSLSVHKAMEFESKSNPVGAYPSNYSVLSIPRARKVHQPLFTTPFTALCSLLFCTYYLTLRSLLSLRRAKFADILILNGPGTCFLLCLAVYANKFLGLPAPLIIYVETFARVESLSLSGKLIRPFADRFVTQWSRHARSDELQPDWWLV